MDKPRATALRVLQAVHERKAYANVALEQALKREELSDQDRRFITELVYGTVKAGETLDWMLEAYMNRPLKKVPPVVRDILRLGIYQIFYLDKVPASAACNEAVKLAKKYGHAGTVKFVNAVLRAAAREPEKARIPSKEADFVAHVALQTSHPRWLVRKFVDLFGEEEAEALCAYNQREPKLTLRTNTLKNTREELLERLRTEGATGVASPWAIEGIVLEEHGSLTSLKALQEGYAQVQDESSMLVAHVMDPQPGETIIDACAAPGGKTTHIAALMGNHGMIRACDIYEHKLRRIRENADRLGVKIIHPQLLDAREIGEKYKGLADRVLVDAPCSGLGVLHRKADARWNKTEEELAVLPSLQLAILESASGALKSGGILVYSTCTVAPEENERVVDAFLQSHPDFALETVGIPGEKCAYVREKLQREGKKTLTLYPQRDGTDGFFISRLRKAAKL